MLLLSIRHLSYALEVRKLKNLSEAARQVHVTQSALTQSLFKLEDELGHKLFTRNVAGMSVTREGEVFLSRFSRAFSHLQSFAAALFVADKSARSAFERGVTSKQLAALITVCDKQNYTAAAAEMRVAQPTLHRTIKNLEMLCGLKLFTRSPVGVESTWRARQLKKWAGLYFAELAQGVDEIAALKGGFSGTIKVGSLPLARTQIVPKTVLKLLAAAPDAEVSIVDGTYEEQLTALLHGQLDIIVGALREPVMSDEITQTALFQDTLSLVVNAAHPLSRSTAVTVADLADANWVAPKQGTPARKVFDAMFCQLGLSQPTAVIECSSLDAIRGLLLNSNRISLLPARQVEIDVQAGILAICNIDLHDEPRQIGYTVRNNWTPTRLQSLYISLLQEHVTELAAGGT